MPSLFTHQFQAKLYRCSRRVASIIERIDLGCASNVMRVLNYFYGIVDCGLRLIDWQGYGSGYPMNLLWE